MTSFMAYFKNLFSSVCTNQFDKFLDKIPKCINDEIRLSFDKPVIDNEIMDAFGQMDPMKALGIDGLSGLFFKEN